MRLKKNILFSGLAVIVIGASAFTVMTVKDQTYAPSDIYAPIARITADYALSPSGQRKAVFDANTEQLPRIEVEPIDLRAARRLVLVSPTWMFRPATPLWAYVENTDLTGKDVVLIMTGNSRFKQSEIDSFAGRIEAHVGRLTKYLFLRRGRIYWQKSREDLLKQVRKDVRELMP
jgi:hypothetical protein